MEMKTEYPVLTKDEERALLEKYQNSNCQLSLDKLVRHNVGIVWHHVNKMGYFSDKHEQEDLFQAGMTGFIQAVNKFDLSTGNKLSTYATPWIRMEMFNSIRKSNKGYTIKNDKRDKVFWNYHKYKKDCTKDYMTQLELEVMSEEIGLDVDKAAEVVRAISRPAKAYLEQEMDDESTPYTVLGKEDDLLSQFAPDKLAQLMSVLTEREAHVIKRRWLDPDDPTYRQLASELEVSTESVRNRERSAIRKMKNEWSILEIERVTKGVKYED